MTKASKSKEKKLFESFLLLKDVKEVERYCLDLMTEAEIQQLSGRLEVAKKLDLGFSQRSVSEETDVSIATVTRISKVLNGAVKGYRLVLDRINGKEN